MFPELRRTGNPEIDRQLDAMVGQLEKFSELQEKIAAAGATGTALSGLVEVSVGATGNLVKVTIDPQAMRTGSEALAEAVTEAYQAAVAQTSANLNEAMADLLPGLAVGEHLAGGRGSVIGPDHQPIDPQDAIQSFLRDLRR